jgi:pimeloyl-ACP methyl ester carboxylesterase
MKPTSLALLLVSLLGLAAPQAAEAALKVAVSGTGPDVLLIPGLACSGAVWDSTVAELSKDHTCHVVTLAGFAGEPAQEGAFIDSALKVLGDYIGTRLHGKPLVVGHSLGGLIALELAAKSGHELGGIVIVDSIPFYSGLRPGVTPEAAVKFADYLRTSLAAQPWDQFLAQNKLSLPMMVISAEHQELVAGWMAKSDPKAVINALGDVVATDARPLLPQVTCAVLVVSAGDGPGAIAEPLLTEQYSGLPKPATFARIPNAHHFVMLDNPAAFWPVLGAFVHSH